MAEVAEPANAVRLAIVGDVHGNLERLTEVASALAGEQPEVALLTGDVALDPPFFGPARYERRAGHDESVREVTRLVGEALSCPVVFVPGNHDLPDPPSDAPATNADGRVVEIAGLSVAGFGGSGPARFGFPYEWGEGDAGSRMEALFETAPRPVDIFLCHTPPIESSLDRCHDGRHVGSQAVRDWLDRAGPRLFVCGHIHEALGLETIEGVACLNAGALGSPFGRSIGWLVEWRDGPRRIERLEVEEGRIERQTVL